MTTNSTSQSGRSSSHNQAQRDPQKRSDAGKRTAESGSSSSSTNRSTQRKKD